MVVVVVAVAVVVVVIFQLLPSGKLFKMMTLRTYFEVIEVVG